MKKSDNSYGFWDRLAEKVGVETFKVIVMIIFVVIVALCAFRNHPLTETLTIVRNSESDSSASVQTTATSASVQATTAESDVQTAEGSGAAAAPAVTSGTLAQTTPYTAASAYSEPEEASPIESVSGNLAEYERPDKSDNNAGTPQISQTEQTAVQSTTAATTVQENGRVININTATAAQLKTLSGIGDVKAQAIIDYRNTHGSFASVDDLILVKGIGEKTLEKIRDSITV